ncbi:hypothetical protein O9929_11890 [Vibrio lentus]|nr:hypothetical protein [Vibrio lentus]
MVSLPMLPTKVMMNVVIVPSTFAQIPNQKVLALLVLNSSSTR